MVQERELGGITQGLGLICSTNFSQWSTARQDPIVGSEWDEVIMAQAQQHYESSRSDAITTMSMSENINESVVGSAGNEYAAEIDLDFISSIPNVQV
jgi:hypothetical protein